MTWQSIPIFGAVVLVAGILTNLLGLALVGGVIFIAGCLLTVLFFLTR